MSGTEDTINNVPRRLPNGKMTRDTGEYQDAWHALGKKAESFYPGYVFASYNPGIRLELREALPDDYYRVLDSVSLSVHAINALRAPNQTNTDIVGGWIPDHE
jgi:hypothetical protein